MWINVIIDATLWILAMLSIILTGTWAVVAQVILCLIFGTFSYVALRVKRADIEEEAKKYDIPMGPVRIWDVMLNSIPEYLLLAMLVYGESYYCAVGLAIYLVSMSRAALKIGASYEE